MEGNFMNFNCSDLTCSFGETIEIEILYMHFTSLKLKTTTNFLFIEQNND